MPYVNKASFFLFMNLSNLNAHLSEFSGLVI
jgi:hypothetical protein